MIKNFRHKGIERFFKIGSKAGINAAHAAWLARQLARLHQAKVPEDMNLPGWRLHALMGDRAGHWSDWVSGNWRLSFTFEGEHAAPIDYLDYH